MKDSLQQQTPLPMLKYQQQSEKRIYSPCSKQRICKKNIKNAYESIGKRQINQSINQSEQQNEFIKSDITNETDKIDRPEKMHFTDVLKHLGIENSYDIESEDELLYQGESERQVKKCEISYTLKSNKRAMIDALKYLFCYSYYIENGEFEKTTINLLDTVILSIADMISKDNIILQKSLVHYYEIIDCINKILPRLSLMDWFVSFEDKWTKILSENTVKYPKAYIKTCIWNWLNDFEFEEQNMLRAIRQEECK